MTSYLFYHPFKKKKEITQEAQTCTGLTYRPVSTAFEVTLNVEGKLIEYHNNITLEFCKLAIIIFFQKFKSKIISDESIDHGEFILQNIEPFNQY